MAERPRSLAQQEILAPLELMKGELIYDAEAIPKVRVADIHLVLPRMYVLIARTSEQRLAARRLLCYPSLAFGAIHDQN
jgi:hypothetical protein